MPRKISELKDLVTVMDALLAEEQNKIGKRRTSPSIKLKARVTIRPDVSEEVQAEGEEKDVQSFVMPVGTSVIIFTANRNKTDRSTLYTFNVEGLLPDRDVLQLSVKCNGELWIVRRHSEAFRVGGKQPFKERDSG